MYNPASLVLVVLVFSSDIGTELVTIESTIGTTQRGGSSRYRRCRCRTLLYLPCIFRLRTETIWLSTTLRILTIWVSTTLRILTIWLSTTLRIFIKFDMAKELLMNQLIMAYKPEGVFMPSLIELNSTRQ